MPEIQSFFNNIKKSEVNLALDQLLSSNPNLILDDSATQIMKNRFNYINQVAGAFMGATLLKKRYINDDIGIYSYLSKYEKKFYRFVFIFYNNGKNVKLYQFTFDDDLVVELEASLKYYLN